MVPRWERGGLVLLLLRPGKSPWAQDGGCSKTPWQKFPECLPHAWSEDGERLERVISAGREEHWPLRLFKEVLSQDRSSQTLSDSSDSCKVLLFMLLIQNSLSFFSFLILLSLLLSIKKKKNPHRQPIQQGWLSLFSLDTLHPDPRLPNWAC